MKSLFLGAAVWLLFMIRSFAIIDANLNGISDVWERTHNQGDLFPETFDPQADPDGDGWVNLVEALAGTSPHDGSSPDGMLRPQVVHIPATYGELDSNGVPSLISPEALTVSWQTMAGKQYTLLVSVDLTSERWIPVDHSFIGSGNEITYNFTLAGQDKLFWRVAVEDTDSDEDQLTDAEEHALGTSSSLADSNDDGISDALSVSMGVDPAADSADLNGDGVADNTYYSVQFEFKYEGHLTIPPRYATDPSSTSAYFTDEVGMDYSVSNSPRYQSIADGRSATKNTRMLDGSLRLDGTEEVTTEGTAFVTWLSTHGVALAPNESLALEPTQTVVSPAQFSVTGDLIRRSTTTTQTTPWVVRQQQAPTNPNPGPILRSGSEVIVTTSWTELSDPLTYQEFWDDYVKSAPWLEGRTEERGPLYDIRHLGPSPGDEDAADYVRDLYKRGTFTINGTISSPSVYWGGQGQDERLKSARWRWVKFNPQNPFGYESASPPAAFQKSFNLPVSQRDLLSEFSIGDLEDSMTAKGFIEIKCLGSQGGSGWQQVPMSLMQGSRLDEPAVMPSLNFGGKTGESLVTFQNLPTEIVSRDRMIAGSFTIPPGWENSFEVQFVNVTTGENLGTYGNLRDSHYGPRVETSDLRLFDTLEQQAYENGSLDPRIREQKVIFCSAGGDTSPIEFYTVFGDLGSIEVKFIHDGTEVGVIQNNLSADAAFGRLIDYFNQTVRDSPLGVIAGAAGGPGALQLPEIHPLARRALVPLFNGFGAWLGAQTDVEVLILGLLDGITQGVLDDKKLIEWVFAQNLHLKYQLSGLLIVQVNRWIEDPYARAMDTANTIRNLMQHGFIEPMQALGGGLGDLAGNFTSWERFKEFNWRVHQGIQLGEYLALVAITNAADVILQSLGDWYVDFCDRMYAGAELGVFQGVTMGDLPAWRRDIRTFYRTFGYSFGYLGEQLLLGHGVVAMSKGMAKLGPQIALTTLPIVKTFGVRVMPFFTKRWAAGLLATGDHEALEQGIRLSQTTRLDSRVVLQTDGAKPVADSIGDSIARQAGAFNGKLLADELQNSPKILQTLRQEATRTLFFDRLGALEKLIGTRLDDVVAKNFTKTYERTILLNANTGEDMFDLTIKSFHSNFAPNGPLDVISDSGKELLEYFFKEPNAGSPWKLGFAGSPNRNLGTFVRGNLIELHSAKIGRHNSASYLDELNDVATEGLDFEYADGLVVQQTSTALSAAGDQMVQKLRESADAALDARGEGCRFQFDVHWLSTNGKPDLARLQDLAIELSRDLEISIDIIDTETAFQQWLP
jgi:hypothetical protein